METFEEKCVAVSEVLGLEQLSKDQRQWVWGWNAIYKGDLLEVKSILAASH